MVDWATPEVDTLSSPALKLDQQLLNQVPFKVKKFVQEKVKEMFNVQRAFLNATGTLGGLHDCIENDSNPPGDSNPSYEEIKVALEQALCLLGSVNAPLSILRRQRVLIVATNRSRMQNQGYLEMTSPPWLQNKPSCQGTSRKIRRKVQGNPFLDVFLNLSQITKVLVQKTVLFSYSSSFSSNISPTLLSSLLSLKRLLSTECALF